MEEKYDLIGINYNRTRRADAYLLKRILYHLQPSKQNTYLDIGCGSGNYTYELHKEGLQYIGIDPSIVMLQKAKQKTTAIKWQIGSAENTSLPDHSIQGITVFLTIHHWKNLTEGFLELSRVMKNHARIVIFTSTPEQMKGYWLSHYFPKMLEDSIAQMPSLKEIKEAFKVSEIEVLDTEPYFIQPNLQDHFLYCGKHKPELYLKAHIRNGISSFSSLANKKEVKEGLQLLQKDISSGKINQIITSYENDLGDYLFIIGKKKSFKSSPLL